MRIYKLAALLLIVLLCFCAACPSSVINEKSDNLAAEASLTEVNSPNSTGNGKINEAAFKKTAPEETKPLISDEILESREFPDRFDGMFPLEQFTNEAHTVNLNEGALADFLKGKNLLLKLHSHNNNSGIVLAAGETGDLWLWIGDAVTGKETYTYNYRYYGRIPGIAGDYDGGRDSFEDREDGSYEVDVTRLKLAPLIFYPDDKIEPAADNIFSDAPFSNQAHTVNLNAGDLKDFMKGKDVYKNIKLHSHDNNGAVIMARSKRVSDYDIRWLWIGDAITGKTAYVVEYADYFAPDDGFFSGYANGGVRDDFTNSENTNEWDVTLNNLGLPEPYKLYGDEVETLDEPTAIDLNRPRSISAQDLAGKWKTVKVNRPKEEGLVFTRDEISEYKDDWGFLLSVEFTMDNPNSNTGSAKLNWAFAAESGVLEMGDDYAGIKLDGNCYINFPMEDERLIIYSLHEVYYMEHRQYI